MKLFKVSKDYAGRRTTWVVFANDESVAKDLIVSHIRPQNPVTFKASLLAVKVEMQPGILFSYTERAVLITD